MFFCNCRPKGAANKCKLSQQQQLRVVVDVVVASLSERTSPKTRSLAAREEARAKKSRVSRSPSEKQPKIHREGVRIETERVLLQAEVARPRPANGRAPSLDARPIRVLLAWRTQQHFAFLGSLSNKLRQFVGIADGR